MLWVKMNSKKTPLKILSGKTVGFKIRCKLTNFVNKNVEIVNADG